MDANDPIMGRVRDKEFQRQEARRKRDMFQNRVMIVGSRGWKDGKTILEAIQMSEATEILVGNDPGVERMARHIALQLDLKIVDFELNWDEGSARALRYEQLWTQGQPRMVLAFCLPHSDDVFGMVRRAKRGGIQTVVVLPDPAIHPPDPTFDNGYTPKDIA